MHVVTFTICIVARSVPSEPLCSCIICSPRCIHQHSRVPVTPLYHRNSSFTVISPLIHSPSTNSCLMLLSNSRREPVERSASGTSSRTDHKRKRGTHSLLFSFFILWYALLSSLSSQRSFTYSIECGRREGNIRCQNEGARRGAHGSPLIHTA